LLFHIVSLYQAKLHLKDLDLHHKCDHPEVLNKVKVEANNNN
jgi:hypothetical protein